MTIHDKTRALEKLARRQHGVFTGEQVATIGFTRRMAFSRVRSGTWIRLAPGVFALPSAAPTWRRQYQAAELSLPGSSLAELAACTVHRFEGFGVVRPELIVAYTHNHRTPLATVHRSDSAAHDDG